LADSIPLPPSRPASPNVTVTPGLRPSRLPPPVSGMFSGSMRSISPALWRTRLRQASFKGAPFHVEQQGRTSGRRTVLHEYPKRDSPYCEDMGLQARRYSIVGYVIQRHPGQMVGDMYNDYDQARDLLIQALEMPEPGVLVDPYWNRVGPELYMCDRYSVTEARERGGYAQFEMSFIEAGEAAFGILYTNTAQLIDQAAYQSMFVTADQINNQLSVLNAQSGGAGSSGQQPLL